MEILAKLFGSSERVRVMRYVVMSGAIAYDAQTVAKSLQLDLSTTRRELKFLTKINCIKECTYTKKIIKNKKNGIEIENKKTEGYKLNPNFVYLDSFKGLLLGKEELASDQIYKDFKKFGKIDFFLVAGIFDGNRENNDVDIVIVGTSLKRTKIEEQIKKLESFIGIELEYVIFDTEEFKYRYMMHDKFVRQILQRKEQSVVDTLNL